MAGLNPQRYQNPYSFHLIWTPKLGAQLSLPPLQSAVRERHLQRKINLNWYLKLDNVNLRYEFHPFQQEFGCHCDLGIMRHIHYLLNIFVSNICVQTPCTNRGSANSVRNLLLSVGFLGCPTILTSLFHIGSYLKLSMSYILL